jgi:hypothetical protein
MKPWGTGTIISRCNDEYGPSPKEDLGKVSQLNSDLGVV